MWPFSSRGSHYGTIAPVPEGLPDFKNFEKSDVNLKVWLPQILVDRVNWLSKVRDVSRPDVIRALLFENLYGKVAYDALVKSVAQERAEDALAVARQTLKVASQPVLGDVVTSDGDVKFSRARSTAIDLEHIGKSVGDIDVLLPSQLYQDLARLALQYRLSSSSYVRKMLVLQLLGEQVHTNWQAAVGAISEEVLAIEKGF